MRFVRAALVVLVASVACTSADPDELEPLVIEEGCQPLLASTTRDEASRAGCLLPYPSDHHRDGTKVALAPAARPRLAANGNEADPHAEHPPDGFSRIPTIVATLPSA